ncbi:phage holin family protein [Patescibacteria group bacterium]
MLKKVLLSIFLNGLALYLLLLVVTVIEYGGGIKLFIISGIFLGLVNFFVKPLIKILSFPLILFTGGFFLIAINAFILWFLSYFLNIIQFQDVTLIFPNILSYVIGAIVFGLINWAENLFVK